jgi:hypothetical protein
VSALDWLNGTAFEAFGQHVIWSDMVGNLVGVPLAFSSGPVFSGLVYLVYLVLVLWGMRAWWLRSRESAAPAVHRPDREPEGAAA